LCESNCIKIPCQKLREIADRHEWIKDNAAAPFSNRSRSRPMSVRWFLSHMDHCRIVAPSGNRSSKYPRLEPPHSFPYLVALFGFHSHSLSWSLYLP
jgi:hypothetical protein